MSYQIKDLDDKTCPSFGQEQFGNPGCENCCAVRPNRFKACLEKTNNSKGEKL